MSIYNSFVYELQKIAKIPGKSLGRTLERPEVSEGKIKFFKSMKKPGKVVEAIEEQGRAAGERKEVAEGLKGLRKHIGHASARSYLAETRVREGEKLKFGKLRARMDIPLKAKTVLSRKHKKLVQTRGEKAFKKQSRKELERSIRTGQVPGR